jgi:hypothetical protein
MENKLNPNWVTGFIDAEGCFHISIYNINKSGNMLKWRVTPAFELGLHIKDLDLLLQIKSFFGNTGNIQFNTNNSVNYQIRDINSIKTILIPHFDKYPLITQKQSDYILFKEIVKLLENGEHLNPEGLNKILNFKASLNNGISDSVLAHFPVIQKVPRAEVKLPDLIDYNWLAGFFSGDGCFFVNISKTNNCIVGSSVKLSISITQHIRDERLMQKIVETLKCGCVYKHSKEAVALKVFAFDNIYNVIVPLFKKYPIKGVKYLDFEDFCLITSMVRSKIHLTFDGLDKIRAIKSGMNKESRL